MNRHKNNKNNFTFLVVFFFILLSLTPIIVYLPNIQDQFLASVGDYTFILNVPTSLKANFTVYSPLLSSEQNTPISLALYSPFYIYLYFYNFLHLPEILGELIFISIIFFTSLISTYYYLNYLFGKCFTSQIKYREIISIIGAIFYTFTPYFIPYFTGGHFQFLLFTGTFPLILINYDKFISHHKIDIKYLVYLFFIFLFTALPYGNLGIVELLFMVIFIYTVLAIIFYKSNLFSSIFRFCTFLGVFIAANLWWLLPTFLTLGNLSELNEQSKETIGGAISFATQNAQILKILLGQPDGGIPLSAKINNYFIIYGIYAVYFLVVASCLWVLRREKSKYLLVILGLLIFAIYFTKGPNPPLGSGFMYLYNNVFGFQAFRRPTSKVFWLCALCLTALGFSGILSLLNSYKNKIFQIVIISLFFSGSIYFVALYGWSKELKTYNIPDFYYESLGYLKSQNVNKVLMLPDLKDYPCPRYGGSLKGLMGVDFMNQLWDFPKYVPDSTAWTLATSKRDKINHLAEQLYQQEDICSLAQELNISHVVVRDDLNDEYYDSKSVQSIKLLVSKNPSLYNNFQEFGDSLASLTVYSVIDKCRSDFITGEKEQDKISYQKISAFKYVVNVDSLSDYEKIILHDSYSDHWNLYLADGHFNLNDLKYLWQRPLADQSQAKEYGYANSWIINSSDIKNNYPSDSYIVNQDGSLSFKLTLYYKPQLYLYYGLIITCLSAFASLVYLLFKFVSNKNVLSNKKKV